MSGWKDRKPYRLVGAYDSETCNIAGITGAVAYPVLHQLGLFGCDIMEIDNENVEQLVNVETYRHTYELTARLDDLIDSVLDYVPVIVCHNLAFDMHALGEWLSCHEARVLAKSRQKPITFTIKDESGNPRLVIWDSLVFSGQSLDAMGRDCGYKKATGGWDYSLIRTPDTPLTADELRYAEHDIYALIAWFAWWLKRNPDIEPQKLGLNVVTKTGVVRERRKRAFDGLKGQGMREDVGRMWLYINRQQAPKDDEELYSMHAATRGGLTFCASRSANVVYDLRGSRECVAGYDATSQHPAQMVSHYYPVDFRKCEHASTLDAAFRLASTVPITKILREFSKPFGVAFYGCFRFTNLRSREGSIYARYGVYPLASARFHNIRYVPNEDNGASDIFRDDLCERGYTDSAEGARYAFGKLVSANLCDVWITELTAFEIGRAYEWDSVQAISGYATARFVRPPDMAVLSVMRFYKAKNLFKIAMQEYEATGTITNGSDLRAVGVAGPVVDAMESGAMADDDIDTVYHALKADLNALFGIEASNEYREDTILGESGIEYHGEKGIKAGPKNPKTWYQFGQRIVGWSRIAQICVMELCAPNVIGIVNGDTDSIKLHIQRDALADIAVSLARYDGALDAAKRHILKRVKAAYPEHYDDLKNIGHYECEFISDCYCAGWNKAYVTYDVDKRDGARHVKFTLAGLPTNDKRDENGRVIRRGVNSFAEVFMQEGATFGQMCDVMLGYNVEYAYDLIGLNARSRPEWGASYHGRVVDYLGVEHGVFEPRALALYRMSKCVNDTSSTINLNNLAIARQNRPTVNSEHAILTWGANDKPEVVYI